MSEAADDVESSTLEVLLRRKYYRSSALALPTIKKPPFNPHSTSFITSLQVRLYIMYETHLYRELVLMYRQCGQIGASPHHESYHCTGIKTPAKLIPPITAELLKTSDRVAQSCEIMDTVNGDS